MFESKAVASFNSDGHIAHLTIPNTMPVESLQKVANEITSFCVKRLEDARNQEIQKAKDEEALKAKELEEAKPEEVVEEAKEPQPVEA